MAHITRAEELKDLQQRAAHAQECQQKRRTQLDKFQEIGAQLAVKVVATLQAVQENRQMVDGKAREENPMQQVFLNYQSAAERVQLQAQEILQQFEDFKDKTSMYTLST